MKKLITLLILFAFAVTISAFELSILKSRLDYYTDEAKCEMLVMLASESNSDSIFCSIKFKRDFLVQHFYLQTGKMNHIPFYVEYLEIGNNELSVILTSGKEEQIFPVELRKLSHKRNAVKIDRATGGLIVDELPFFPFGFYCYSPVQPTLPEEEVVKGFNMISPYQQIKDSSLEERRNYMNRCAELGMKVHYNLCSVAGGGGAGSARRKLSDRKLEKLLIKEVNTFKDHPALLAWYISDEPVLQGMSPKKLEKVYQKIKELDPYHPITIVFMKPQKAKKYENAMDIVMADPYPIPKGSVETVAKVTRRLVDEFQYKKPVWIVPQAFGGNEWWEREPTRQELRAMTQLAIANGATGIQYFIRHGLNGFPKSTTTWAECGAMALETTEISPFILTGEKIVGIECDLKQLEIEAWKFNSNITILVVNNKNEPIEFNVLIPDSMTTKNIHLPFENRILPIIDNSFSDMIAGYGSKVFQILSNDDTNIALDNLVLDPSFEDNVSVGIPSYCYANAGSDKGSTYFIDSRTSYDGTHSLRLNTPTYGKGPLLKFFKVKLKNNVSYTFSIWAKAAPKLPQPREKRGFFDKLFFPDKKIEKKAFTFKMQIGSQKTFFEISEKWKKYEIEIMKKGKEGKTYNGYPKLELIGQGTAWFDLMEIIPKK